MIAMAIVLCVLVLAVGNFMSAKPSASELWLDKVRMTARTMGLSPKLVPYPNWLPPKTTATSNSPYAHKTQGMIAQYGVLDDNWQLPQATFWAVDGKWYRQDMPSNDERESHVRLAKKANRLDGVLIDLSDFEPYLLGLSMKANSVFVMWYDDKYAHAHSKANKDETLIKEQLNALKKQLYAWGEMVNGL